MGGRRGRGIKINKKYSWCKQPNGKYTIFDVPILSVYEKLIEKEDGETEKRTLGKEGLQEIVDNFCQERMTGYYPPIFIGHQGKSYENYHINSDKVGFADSLYVDRDIIFADFTEIEGETFSKIQNIDYPSRSVEYDFNSKIITGIALLKSRRPYFKFPFLALEDENIELAGEKIEQYQYRAEVEIFEGRKRMFEFLKKNKKEETVALDKENKQENQEDNSEGQPVAGGEDESKFAQILLALQNLTSLLEKKAITEVPGEIPEPIALQQDSPVSPVSPVSISDIAKVVQAETAKMRLDFQDEIKDLKSVREAIVWEDRLRSMCEVSGEDFEANRKFLSSFESNKDREKFLSYAEVQFQKHPESPAARFLENLENSDAFLEDKKYKNVSGRTKQVAKKAAQDYQHTVGQKNTALATQFQKRFPSEEYFVEYVIKSEEKDPGSYKRDFFRG